MNRTGTKTPLFSCIFTVLNFIYTTSFNIRNALLLQRMPPMKVLGSGQLPENWACEKSKPGFCRGRKKKKKLCYQKLEVTKSLQNISHQWIHKHVNLPLDQEPGHCQWHDNEKHFYAEEQVWKDLKQEEW